MGIHTIIRATSPGYNGAQIELPNEYTLADVEQAMLDKYSENFNFTAIYPYGPYKRVYSNTLSIVLKKEE